MSLNGPLSGIRFSGLASGIDVESIVTQLIQVESIGITRLRAQQAQLTARQSIYSQFRSTLIGLNSSLNRLNVASAYNPVKVSSSDDTIATASADTNAVSGTYSLDVQALAKAHKASSSAQTNSTDPLGYSGSFMVNGRNVDVVATDTLSDVAGKINSLNNGVTASILNGGTGSTYMVLTSNATGKNNAVQLANLSGTALASLGYLSAGAAIVRDNSAGANTARSYGLTSDTTKLSSLTGSSATGSIIIGSGSSLINIDFSTDSLQDIAAKINSSGELDVSATVVTEKKDGNTTYKLELSGTGVPSTVIDSSGLLEALGVYQRGFSSELVAAQDSKVVIDNLTINSDKNSITNVIQGVTVNLSKVGTTTLDLTKDTEAITSSIKGLQTGFNDVISYIKQNSKFDDKTFQSGALFGDQTASQVSAALNDLLFSNLGTGTYKNLTDLGFSLDDQGSLQLDEAKLKKAISTDLDGVRKLMMATGSSANSTLRYVSSSSQTLASSSTGYSVDITQAATKSVSVATVAKTAPNVAGETLTFGGLLFGNTTINLSLDANSSLNDIINKINSDSRLKDLVTASNNGGALQVEAKRYGAAGVFSLVSNLAADVDNSGIGTSGGAMTNGLDVAGTINGEAATGTGQFLLGNDSSPNIKGLQIQYTGSATGNVGNFVFNRGLSSLMSFRLNSFTDSVNGLLSSVDKTLTQQISDIDDRISSISDRLTAREAFLRQKFGAMEQAISALQSQGSQLASILNSGG